MTAIETELDRLLDDFSHRARQQQRRRSISRGVFEHQRAKALQNPHALHPLRRRRLEFRDEGLTLDELAERSTVAKTVIADIEKGKTNGSDATWKRLCLALSCDRRDIDPSFFLGGH